MPFFLEVSYKPTYPPLDLNFKFEIRWVVISVCGPYDSYAKVPELLPPTHCYFNCPSHYRFLHIFMRSKFVISNHSKWPNILNLKKVTTTKLVQQRPLSVMQWLKGEPLLEQGG